MLNLNTLRFGHVAQPTHSSRQPLRFAATTDHVQFGTKKEKEDKPINEDNEPFPPKPYQI